MPATNYGLGRKGKRRTVEITLPSYKDPDNPALGHNVCLVRVPDPQSLIAAGILDEFDSLTRLIQLEHFDRVDPRKQSAEQQAKTLKTLAESQKDIMSALEMVDKLVEFMVVEPKVLRPIKRDSHGKPVLVGGHEIPLAESERDKDTLYTDDVDLDDRMFILQYSVGGSDDLESFRQGTQEIMGNLEAVQGIPMSTE